ncbi:MAG: hypothetical protein AAFV19_02880 [Pseudomonadota bacterium]
MTTVQRRTMLIGLAAGIAASTLAPAAAHTLYPQWVAYRRKHLLVGCHRKDLETYRLAQDLVEEINHALPKAKARVARAPHPERLASLIGTDQMEIAILSRADAVEMAGGQGKFAPYGQIPLTWINDLSGYLLVADKDLPLRHGWMLASALGESGRAKHPETTDLPLHPGAAAKLDGLELDDLPGE